MDQTDAANHEGAPDRRLQVVQVQCRRAGRRQDSIRRYRRAHTLQARNVVRAVPHRVIGHVDDVVAGSRTGSQNGRNAGHRLGATVDDTIEVHEKKHEQDAN